MRFVVQIFIILLLFQGCSTKNREFAHTVFQTNGATMMREYYELLDRLLLKLGAKLIKRNSEIFSKDILFYIKNDMDNFQNSINLPMVKSQKEDNFKEYLKVAFSKKGYKKRGDYLLVGLYKLFYYSFSMKSFHKISALQYDAKRLQLGYEILQVVAWKIKSAKDIKGSYLYLTWQNNWQVELAKRLKKGEKLSAKLINSLQYIKNKKENLLSPSNLSFEKLFGKMLLLYEEALRRVGVEPKSLSADALRTLFLIL